MISGTIPTTPRVKDSAPGKSSSGKANSPRCAQNKIERTGAGLFTVSPPYPRPAFVNASSLPVEASGRGFN